MRVLSWIFYAALFVLALVFALSNTDPAELRLFSGYAKTWRAPLVVFLLSFLGIGVILGLLSAVPAIFRLRREIARLRRELRQLGKIATKNAQESSDSAPVLPPPPASASTPLGV